MGRKKNHIRKDYNPYKDVKHETLDGFVKVTYEELLTQTIVVCGYARNPMTNHKGLIKSYCSLKEDNCLRFKDYNIGKDCITYKKHFE